MTHGGKNDKSVAPKSILSLVERFELYQESYRSGHYNEAQLRHDFLDPFWEILGWDIHNKQGFAEAYRDVIYEDALRIGHATKAPDYCFRIGGTRKFFLEAKKPSVLIKEDVSPAFQLRRYAWSAKLPLSVLSNFEEFVVYDTHVRPVKDDPASTARIFCCTFVEYAEKWDWIASIFSRDAVLKGSFDKFAEGTRAKRGTASVDDAFLDEIESWRKSLAQNLALRNPKLTQRELNFAVQSIIDRIIFLRICEDRNIEDYGRLLALVNGGDIYQRLCELFQEADDKYNSGLFHFKAEKGRHEPPDELTPGLHVDDKLLRDVLRNLYYPESPYEFSVLSIDILGQVYERFLGKTIRLTEGHRAVVEDKPEVKKAGGVYYTPTYIVDYIVKNAVGKLLESTTPAQAAKLRVLDPACGSGSFLIGAYQYFLDWHLNWYATNGPGRRAKGSKPALIQAPGGGWRLTIAERKRILLNNIFGVDIDSQAVEVTKLSLLLKVLEGETEQTIQPLLRLFKERALPDLGDNIKCGNSLVGSDFYDGQQISLLDDERRLQINAFDWQSEFPEIMGSGGFDAVIGNPPYGMLHDTRAAQYVLAHYKTTEGRFDHFELFLERAGDLSKAQHGRVMFIIPSPFLSNVYSQRLRRFLVNRFRVEEITNFGMDVFRDPTVHTCIICIRKCSPKAGYVKIRQKVLHSSQLTEAYDFQLAQGDLARGPTGSFDIFASPEKQGLLSKMERGTNPLGDICFIRQCIKTGNDATYVETSNRRLAQPWKPSLRGRSIDRYRIKETSLWVKYGDWLARNWQNRTFYETAKVAVRETGDRIVATLDLDHRYFLSSLYSVYPKNPDERVSLTYILGILNSRLATWFVKVIAFDLTAGAFTKIRTNQLGRLPIRCIDFSNKRQSHFHDRLVELVERMLELHRKRAAKTPEEQTALKRQIVATDAQIDTLVYELYGLTEQEIKIVEKAP